MIPLNGLQAIIGWEENDHQSLDEQPLASTRSGQPLDGLVLT